MGNKNVFISCFHSRVVDICKQQWSVNVTAKPKLRTYLTFKSILEPERYLTLNCNVKFIQVLARFRCSSLPLAIEAGRHQGIDPQLRFCTLCNSGAVEDEFHFLLKCSVYINLRVEFLPRQAYTDPNYDKFKRLMST